MRALVTGGAGFVGRHMVRELLARGYDVVSVDLRPFESPTPHMTDVRLPSHIHIIGDVRVWGFGMDSYDLVVHCAYRVGGRAAIDGVNMNLAHNLQLDARLLDWAVRTGQSRVIYFSSSAVYPVELQRMHSWRPLVEGDADALSLGLGLPDADYGWAKLTGERLVARAQREDVDVTVVRPFSGYGGDQDNTYPFRAFADRVRRREDPFTVWGDPDQVRDWIHIDDVINGALAVATCGTAEPINLCTGRPTSMRTLLRMMQEHAPGYDPDILVDQAAPMGVFGRVGDPRRMLQVYTPKVTLEEGIARAFTDVDSD